MSVRDAAFRRARYSCEWPGCPAPASELAHLHSKGMGGKRGRVVDTLDNVIAACWLHARITDGEGAGRFGLPTRADRIDPRVETLKMLATTGYLDELGGLENLVGSVAWHRAEGLRRVVAGKTEEAS